MEATESGDNKKIENNPADSQQEADVNEKEISPSTDKLVKKIPTSLDDNSSSEEKKKKEESW
ncbi:MAG: hypothetical protein ABIH42_02710, partial [Planctomycetota bacterium]